VNVRLTAMILVTCSGIAIAMSGIASPIVPPTSKLLASDGATWDQFGSSVSISGDVTVIGSPGAPGNSEDSGAAYVFRFDGSNWIEEAKLSSSDALFQDSFGRAVATSGELIAVHGVVTDSSPPERAVYVFRYDGANWIEEAKLLASDGEPLDEFGSALSVDGDVILVGARENNERGGNAGAAYMFRFNGSNWVEEIKLLGSGISGGDLFGFSVALSGDTALVGAPRNSPGSAYIFRFNGSSWVEEAKLEASDPETSRQFGDSVAISGDTVIVGDPQNDEVNDEIGELGAAYIFRFNGNDWIEDAKLRAAEIVDQNSYFGASVSTTEDLAVISGNPPGLPPRAYVFRRFGVVWEESATLVPDPAYMGSILRTAMSSDTALLGANQYPEPKLMLEPPSRTWR